MSFRNAAEGRKVIDQMVKSGIKPVEMTYICLLRAFAKQGDVDAIFKELEKMRDANVVIERSDYLEIVYDLGVNEHFDQIDRLLSIIPTTGYFNRNAAAIIIRLLNKGKDVAAMKILKIMPVIESKDGPTRDSGNFIINHLVKLNRPVSYILSVCDDLERDGLHSQAFKTLAHKLSENGSIDAAVEVLRHIKARGWPKLDEQDFRPIIINAQPEEMLELLQIMINEFDIRLTFYVARHYVVARLNLDNPEHTVKELLRAKVSLYVASVSVVFQCLKQNRLKDAADTAVKFNSILDPRIMYEQLIGALIATKDFDSYIRLLRMMYERFDEIANFKHEPNVGVQVKTGSYGRSTMIGNILYDTVKMFVPSARVDALNTIAKLLLQEGIGISSNEAKRLRESFASDMTKELESLLHQLSSVDLEPQPIEKVKFNERMSSEQFEHVVRTGNATGKNTLNMNLLRSYHAEGKLSKYEELFSQLPDDKLKKSVYANLIDLCVRSNELDRVLQVIEQARQKFPDFVLNIDFLLDAVSAFIEANRVDEALELLNNNGGPFKDDDKDRSQSSATKPLHILRQLLKAGKERELELAFDTLIKNNYARISEKLLAPLVQVHTVGGNLPKAIETFRKLSRKYQIAPLVDELIEELVEANDQVSLDIIVNETAKGSGEYQMLTNLFFAYLKHDRINESQKMLPQLMKFDLELAYCTREILKHNQPGSVKYIENFLQATNSMASVIDRRDVYVLLVRLYQKVRAPQKGLDLSVKLQEHSETPSPEFLIELGQLLSDNGYDVPFEIPNQRNEFRSEPDRHIRVISPRYERVYTLKKALHNESLDRIRETYRRLAADDRLTQKEYNILIDKFLDGQHLREASDVLQRAAQGNVKPQSSTLRRFLSSVKADGDVELVKEVNRYLPKQWKSGFKFDAVVKKTKSIPSERVPDAPYEDICQQFTAAESNSDLEQKFPLDGTDAIFRILESQPELAPNCKSYLTQ